MNAIRIFLQRLFPDTTGRGRAIRRLRVWILDRRGFQAERRLRSLHRDFERFKQIIRERDLRKIMLIIAPVRLLENEGQRATNLALEFSQRGCAVVFVYFRWPGQKYQPQNRIENAILQIALDDFIFRNAYILHAFCQLERLMLVEFPYPELFDLFSEAQACGWVTVYDVVDHWRAFHQVGQASWFNLDFEAYLCTNADLILTVSSELQQWIETQFGKSAQILQNGLVPAIADSEKEIYLERGEVTLGYFGYLSEAWFDWQLLASVQKLRPDWRFYLIGYGCDSQRLHQLPEEIVYMGKLPRHELAACARNWDAGLIPFKPGVLAGGADPIKTYEYLAMDLPVVTTGVKAPPGAERFVKQAANAEQFIQLIEQGISQRGSLRIARRAYSQGCSWQQRVDELFAGLESCLAVQQKNQLVWEGK